LEPTRREVATSMVEHSRKSFEVGPGVAFRRPVEGFVNASRTCGPFGNMVMMIS